MTTLIASLGSGKGTWAKIFRLIKAEDWEKIILIGTEFFIESFRQKSEPNAKILLLTISEKESYVETIKKLSNVLSKEVLGVEVALNLTSGTGREHMTILASVLKAGFGIRLVDIEDDSIIELSGV